jgi:hypothetical protein
MEPSLTMPLIEHISAFPRLLDCGGAPGTIVSFVLECRFALAPRHVHEFGSGCPQQPGNHDEACSAVPFRSLSFLSDGVNVRVRKGMVQSFKASDGAKRSITMAFVPT